MDFRYSSNKKVGTLVILRWMLFIITGETDVNINKITNVGSRFNDINNRVHCRNTNYRLHNKIADTPAVNCILVRYRHCRMARISMRMEYWRMEHWRSLDKN